MYILKFLIINEKNIIAISPLVISITTILDLILLI